LDEPSSAANTPATDRVTVILRWVVGLILLAIVLAGSWYGFAYLSTPPALRNPTATHFHFRMQIINGGQAVNFADDKFQTAFNSDICSAALTQQPVHFHDKLDQFVHIHWNNLTGGIVLKNYGWNFIGGPNGTLGYRFDKLPQLIKVPIHGHDLPARESDANYYIYTGDSTSYHQRNWNDFLTMDLAKFFTGSMNVGLLDRIIPAAQADSVSEEKLTMLNHVAGSVVIFVQKDAPTNVQVKDRFNHLVPLPLSACGG
jgi:hypothetical protein